MAREKVRTLSVIIASIVKVYDTEGWNTDLLVAMVQVFLGMVAVGVIVVVSKNITFVVFVVVIAMMLAMVVVVMLVVVMNHPPTPPPPIESIYGRTKWSHNRLRR